MEHPPLSLTLVTLSLTLSQAERAPAKLWSPVSCTVPGLGRMLNIHFQHSFFFVYICLCCFSFQNFSTSARTVSGVSGRPAPMSLCRCPAFVRRLSDRRSCRRFSSTCCATRAGGCGWPRSRRWGRSSRRLRTRPSRPCYTTRTGKLSLRTPTSWPRGEELFIYFYSLSSVPLQWA